MTVLTTLFERLLQISTLNLANMLSKESPLVRCISRQNYNDLYGAPYWAILRTFIISPKLRLSVAWSFSYNHAEI